MFNPFRWLLDYWTGLMSDPFEEEIPLLPDSERPDPLGVEDMDTQPIKPVDTLLCRNCGHQIELRYYGYHVEWCGIYDDFYRKPEDKELDW